MALEFLHGVETVNVGSSARPIQQLRSNIIGLVGTAPQGVVNELVLCLSDTDDAQFGVDTEGFTLPSTLKLLRDGGAGAIIVVNVMDASDITPAQVTLNNVIGGIDEHGRRSGLQKLLEGYSTFGFDAKIIIAPYFATAAPVQAALKTIADKLKAVAYMDLPLGFTYSEAIQARGGNVLGVQIYQTSSDRMRICYPHTIHFSPLTSGNTFVPLSIDAAAARAKRDIEVGYWTSSSNQELTGVLGLERPITSRINDPDSEANALNAAGITTVFNAFGTGFRLWGNRTAAFPTNTGFTNFEQVRRTQDMIEGAIEQGSLQFLDGDIDQGNIDAVVMSVNGLFNTLYGRKAILGGKCWFDPSRTTALEEAAGQIRFQYKYTPKFPMEHMTFESEIVVDYLVTLKRTTVGGV